MSKPTLEEINQSIEELAAYRDRLYKELSNIAKKLQMPPTKIKRTLQDHPEIKDIEKTLSSLINKRDKERQLG